MLENTISQALRLISEQFGDLAGIKHMSNFNAMIIARASIAKEGMTFLMFKEKGVRV